MSKAKSPVALALAEARHALKAQKAIVAANQAGDRATLRADSFIPLTMALVYILLLFYFKSIGGYRALKIEEQV